MQLPGEPREHYVARLQWADARTLLVQQLNRLQNTARYLLAEAASGSVREMWRDHDEAFITIGFGGLPEARALAGGNELPRDQREGRLDARLPRHARGSRNAGDARSVRRHRRRRRRREEWMGVFRGVAGECHAALSVSRPARRSGRSRPRHAGGVHRLERLHDLAGRTIRAFTGIRASTTRASASSSRCRRTSRST